MKDTIDIMKDIFQFDFKFLNFKLPITKFCIEILHEITCPCIIKCVNIIIL